MSGAPQEAPIEHWGDHDSPADEAFWTKRAMEAAIARWWHPQRNTTEPLADVTLCINRVRGAVILTEVACTAYASATPTEPIRADPDRPGGV